MSAIKEFREFFLRAVITTLGSKPDKENPFPVTYSVNGATKFNRFLKGHYPSENVFKKLFESVTFKLNQEDTATTTNHGLVVIANDTKAINRSDNASTDFSAAVAPHQLPDVILTADGGTDTLISTEENTDFSVISYNRNLSSKRKRIFLIASKTQKKYLQATFVKTDNTLDNIGAGANLLKGNLVAGKYYEFKAILFINADLTAGLKINLAGTATATDIIFLVSYLEDGTALCEFKSRATALNTVPLSIDTSYQKGTCIIEGTILCNVGGTLEVHFAQKNSNASTSSVIKGSYLVIKELDV